MSAIKSIEHEGFYYVETTDGIIAKGCRRCGGTGHYSFNGMDSICYLCGNVWEARLGDIFETRQQAEKWCHERAVRKAQADRKRQAEHQKKVDAAEARRQALKAADPEVYEFLMGIVIEGDDQHLYPSYDEWAAAQSNVKLEKDGFIRTMAETLRWVAPSKDFTPNMIAAVRRTMERRAAQAAEAEAHPAPSGRVVVTGEIASAKVVEGDYGTSYKVLVKDDQGFKVWCSLPKAQVEQAIEEYNETHPEAYTWGPACWLLGADGTDEQGIKGRRITFTATLEPSKDDVSFAFGSRPAKGAWL
ncbi:hypothetical protein IXEL_31 [Microbacterium phage Ixel]|nr:hypothetical protein IXEL_31 [Microbacterium phage Ixel]